MIEVGLGWREFKHLENTALVPHRPPVTDFVTSVQNVEGNLTNVASMNILIIVFSNDYVCSFLMRSSKKPVIDSEEGSQMIFLANVMRPTQQAPLCASF